jgi:hypothetical protein
MRWTRREHPGRDRQVDDELWFIVVECGVPAGEREEYVVFARELYHSLRRPPVPDFADETKQTVQRWFERGLKGQYLWAIGEQLRVRLFPAEEVHRGQGH